MKTLYVFLSIFVIPLLCFAQFGPQQIISIQTLNANDAIAADIDGDGDMDVITSSTGDSTISFFRNIDGLGSFGHG